MTGRSLSEIGRQIGRSGVHVGRAVRGHQKVSGETLVAIWRACGLKAGKLAGFSDAETRIIARFFDE